MKKHVACIPTSKQYGEDRVSLDVPRHVAAAVTCESNEPECLGLIKYTRLQADVLNMCLSLFILTSIVMIC